jgi:alcohol dehydrogenase (cytochrome c)
MSNWDLGVREDGTPIPNPQKEAIIPGALVSPIEGGVANWQPPAFNPDLGLFYTHENNGFNIVYLTDPDPRGSMGLGGKRVAIVGFDGNAFNALDYRTGEAVWRHEWPGGGGQGYPLCLCALLIRSCYESHSLWHGRRRGRRLYRRSASHGGPT